MKKWLVTGISGSGRIELLNCIQKEAEKRSNKIMCHDVGDLIRQQCKKHRMKRTDKLILDVDLPVLRLLRESAMKEVELSIEKKPEIEHHLIGVHATFRWRGRLIPGISYTDLISLKPNAMLNVVHDVKEIYATNKKNPKWDSESLPDLRETQDWMIEEEFITEVLAEVLNVPMYLVARNHNIKNVSDLILTKKKKIYLSYPITAVEDENPELLENIQGPILKKLEDLFVVFNPLAVEDMALLHKGTGEEFPELVEQLTPRVTEMIKSRTIERDFQFIDQVDAVVVFYLTDKLSPGVLAEIFYAHRNMKPVFLVLPGKKSPFIEDATTEIFEDIEALMKRLEGYAKE